jgi:hypothetical protein
LRGTGARGGWGGGPLIHFYALNVFLQVISLVLKIFLSPIRHMEMP